MASLPFLAYVVEFTIKGNIWFKNEFYDYTIILG
jgi:hypothetical protein